MKIEYGDPRLPEGFWAKVSRQRNGCWHWTGSIAPKTGYGNYWRTPVRDKAYGPTVAHRWAFHILVRELIPRGQPGHLQVDHDCHNRSRSCEGGPTCFHRRCVNPNHLSAKTPVENTQGSRHTAASKNRAKTHCVNGHPLSGDNLGYQAGGKRYCKTCATEKATTNRQRRLADERGEGWTKTEWNSKKTHCPQGHPYDEENTYWFKTKSGWGRACKLCASERSRAHAASKRSGEVPAGNRADWTHCKNGHEFTDESTYWYQSGGKWKRRCKTCRQEYGARRYAESKGG